MTARTKAAAPLVGRAAIVSARAASLPEVSRFTPPVLAGTLPRTTVGILCGYVARLDVDLAANGRSRCGGAQNPR
jgi:hypothetical protein